MPGFGQGQRAACAVPDDNPVDTAGTLPEPAGAGQPWCAGR